MTRSSDPPFGSQNSQLWGWLLGRCYERSRKARTRRHRDAALHVARLVQHQSELSYDYGGCARAQSTVVSMPLNGRARSVDTRTRHGKGSTPHSELAWMGYHRTPGVQNSVVMSSHLFGVGSGGNYKYDREVAACAARP